MRIVGAGEALETWNSLGFRTENANCLGARETLGSVVFAWVPYLKCEFGVLAKRLEHRFLFGSTAKMRIVDASEALET